MIGRVLGRVGAAGPVCVFLLLAPPASAQPPPAPTAPAVISRNAAGEATVRAVRLAEPLHVDGVLDEAIYQTVPAIDDLIQSLPKTGSPPTERTEAWVLFDNANIYITARCWDSAPPSRWVANEMRRDSIRIGEQDTFSVMLDTFHDRRNGYSFNTSPLGARYDSQLTNESSTNPDWNTIWDVRSGRFEGGWTVEIAVPFKSLRYNAGQAQVWGIQMRRHITRKNEWIHLTPLPAATGDRRGFLLVSMAATLVGLDLPPAASNVEIKPYVTSRVSTDRIRVPRINNDGDADFGVDGKYGITANLTADLTYNTDFAQVEVDEQQVNLTRFNLVLPEKRDFFLEGRGIFEFGRQSGAGATVATDTPQVFYSRRIGLNAGQVVPINAGGRVTGRAGKFTLGLLNLATGAQPAALTPATNFTVVRVKRDVLRRSNVGMIATNRSRSATGGGANQAYGVDGAFSFFQNVSLSGYWAKTRSEGRSGDEVSHAARFDYSGDRYGARVEHLLVGGNFNPEVGILRRTNFRRESAAARFSPRPKSGVIRKYTWDGNLEYFINGAGHTESSQQTGHFDIEFHNSDRITTEFNRNFELLVRPFPISSGVTIPTGQYDFNDALATYTLGPQRRVSGTLTVQYGQFYNGNITVASYSGGRVSVTKHLSFDPTISINRVHLPSGQFTTRLYRTRTDYAFTPWMFATALLQYNSADQSFSSNVRLRWEYRPGSEFFAVYTDERDTTAHGFPLLKNRAFVIKINRLFMF